MRLLMTLWSHRQRPIDPRSSLILAAHQIAIITNLPPHPSIWPAGAAAGTCAAGLADQAAEAAAGPEQQVREL